MQQQYKPEFVRRVDALTLMHGFWTTTLQSARVVTRRHLLEKAVADSAVRQRTHAAPCPMLDVESVGQRDTSPAKSCVVQPLGY
jgi:hypothetical protein